MFNTIKKTVYNWINNLFTELSKTEYETIKKELLSSLVLHVDETPIKINAE